MARPAESNTTGLAFATVRFTSLYVGCGVVVPATYVFIFPPVTGLALLSSPMNLGAGMTVPAIIGSFFWRRVMLP